MTEALRTILFVSTLGALLGGTAHAAPPGYADVVIDPNWEIAAWSDPMLLAGNVSVLAGPDGKMLLASVGMAPLPANATASDRLTARRVAETKAKAAIARFMGSTVETTTTLETERVTVTTTDEEARVQRVTAARKVFLELTTERAQQTLRGVRALGSWTADGASAVLVGVEVPAS